MKKETITSSSPTIINVNYKQLVQKMTIFDCLSRIDCQGEKKNVTIMMTNEINWILIIFENDQWISGVN